MKSVIRFIFSATFIFLVLTMLIRLLQQASHPEASGFCYEHSVLNELTLDQEHYRNWYIKNHPNDFCTYYQSRQSISLARERERNAMQIQGEDYQQYWGTVYRQLIAQNRTDIAFLADSLVSISIQEGLDPMGFAELIVSFVQDIPYTYILHVDCNSKETSDHPCMGNQAYGILAPYEFLHTLRGDCDTRAVLLFALLERLGFDPAIAISSNYAHAMIALNIPSSGDYLTYGRNKYYFWETTATGWSIGMLPPTCNNVNYWKIALVNEL